MSNSDAMNSEIRFLEEVEEKLKTRITEINASFLEGEKQIESMHDYYWENYTEMDEYGYENYDNQQALLGEVNANNERLMKKQRLKKMIDSPYFGRVDFLFEGEEESESFYIGIGNFAPKAGMTPLIYDWRAPVSGLFYDYDRGQASYEAPGGTIEGEITSKWQYKIKKGKMVYAFESDTKIKGQSSGHSGSRRKWENLRCTAPDCISFVSRQEKFKSIGYPDPFTEQRICRLYFPHSARAWRRKYPGDEF